MDYRTAEGATAGSSPASGILDSVKERASSQLSTQKGLATEGLDVLANAVRQTTQQLRSDQHDTIAQYVDRAADQLERFSASIRDKDVNELLREAQQFAHRQPALFIGGSFVAGLLAARFLKSSRQSAPAGNYRAYSDMYEAPSTSTYGAPAAPTFRGGDYPPFREQL